MEKANAIQFFSKLNKKLEEYKADKNSWDLDADGIYIIVNGDAVIVNPFDDFVFKAEQLGKFSVFGASKFLQ